MGERIDQFCDELKNQLEEADRRLSELRSRVDHFVNQDEETVESKREEIGRRLEARREELKNKTQELGERAAQMKQNIADKLASWKASRQQQSLDDRATNTAEYARVAIGCAVSAIEEAELAVADAAVARHDADTTRAKAA